MNLLVEKIFVAQVAMVIAMIGSLLFLFLVREALAVSDPWQRLQDSIKEETPAKAVQEGRSRQDPWRRLQALYLPFTEEQEAQALVDPSAGNKVSEYLLDILRPFSRSISEASQKFGIPPEIIGAVIMVESGGNPQAAASAGSARGLMQTISGTFRSARSALLDQGTSISTSPFDPHASIMAGGWYLDRMYTQAAADRKPGVGNRSRIDSWRCPVEYYYAGPSNGKNNKEIVIIYSGGRKVVIDKPAYSEKVLRWAKIMHQRR